MEYNKCVWMMQCTGHLFVQRIGVDQRAVKVDAKRDIRYRELARLIRRS